MANLFTGIAGQEYYNPVSGMKIKATEGQQFSEQWEPVSSTGNTSPPIVSSSDGIRDDIKSVKSEASEGVGSIGDLDKLYSSVISEYINQPTGGYSEDITTAESEAEKLRKSLGLLTEDEEKQIKGEGESAYAQYLPLIQQTEEAKRKGLPKAVVGAGERGGFMSTQFAGGAALQPTEGGDFVGAGGELSNIKSEYDRNIALVVSEATRARQIAESAARQAIKTGKREDLNLMYQAIDRMKENFDKVEQQQKAKVDAIYQYSQWQQTTTTFKNALADRETAIAENKEDRIIAAEDRARTIATDQFNNVMKLTGVNGIKNNKAKFEEMFKEIGWDDISIDDVISYMEAEEAAGNAPELRNDPDGNLIAIKYNPETKKYDTEIVMRKTKTGTGPAEAKVTKEMIDSLIKSGNTDVDYSLVGQPVSSLSGKVLKDGEKLDETTVSILLQGAIDKNGNLNITKLPADQRVEIIDRAKELGLFDESDEETKGWFARQWEDFKRGINPFD